MNTIRIGRTTAVGVLVALTLSACGTEQPGPAVEKSSVVQPKVEGIGSADAVERRMAAATQSGMTGTPDALERRLAVADESTSSCRTSADAAERRGGSACGS